MDRGTFFLLLGIRSAADVDSVLVGRDRGAYRGAVQRDAQVQWMYHLHRGADANFAAHHVETLPRARRGVGGEPRAGGRGLVAQVPR